MPFLYQVTFALALLSVGIAAPVNNVQKRSGFSIQQTANSNFKADGLSAYRKAVAKYARHASRLGLVDAKNGSVTATPEQYDSEYLSPVTIGEQDFVLDFDTGSSDFWVFGPGVTGREKTYKPTGSPEDGLTWQISYGDGSSASGTVYKDTVTIGGIAVEGQAVEAANKASKQFTEGPQDGLLGLAFSSINTVKPTPQNTWFDTAVAQGLDPIFGVNLKKGEAGSYDFGSVDTSAFSGELAYTDVDSSQGFWSITPDSAKIGDTEISPDTGIADTGTTLLLLSDETVSAYYEKVEGAENDQQQGGYVFDCDAKLPDFTVTVGGFDSVIPGDYMNYAPTGSGNSKHSNSLCESIWPTDTL